MKGIRNFYVAFCHVFSAPVFIPSGFGTKNRLQKSVPISAPIFGVDLGADLWSDCVSSALQTATTDRQTIHANSSISSLSAVA